MTASRNRKRKSSESKAVREEVGCSGQKYRRVSRASPRPVGQHDDAQLQVSLALATPATLGRQWPPGTKPPVHSFSAPLTVQHHIEDASLPHDSSYNSNRVSDVVDVSLVGLPPQRSGDKQGSFFVFPAEIRNIIYDHSLHWPDCVSLYRSFYRQIPAYPKGDEPHQECHQRKFKTPTILLLCRRVTQECLPILKSRCFVIDRLPPFMPSGLTSITDFIGRRTLQSLHHIDIRIGLGEGPLGSGWIWTKLLDEILAILSERNSFVRLRLLVRMCDKRMKMRDFRRANPNVFAPGEIIIETWHIEGQIATFISRHPRSGNVDNALPPDRIYPDREMFPGSIMQFVEALPASSWSDEEVTRRLGGANGV
ncbi:hypothetical protein VPNG_04846 [Cytospora leucostoma]|uniref:Uncharacterized protein n=1 Tax=Cytospora leucostoma TaxID=1230097 RepID=A0A423XB96_9PEZI|nr:hypothetical protein VPNG_04846 [Cytospora leucostoma]